MKNFIVGDFAMVVLGSSKDQIKGDRVEIQAMYQVDDFIKVDAITVSTKHKFWCKYSDLMPII